RLTIESTPALPLPQPSAIVIRDLRGWGMRHSLWLGGLVVLTLAGTHAVAQQDAPEPQSISSLSQLACSTGLLREVNVDLDSGYLAMMGITESVSIRVLTSGNREVMFPLAQCNNARRAADRPGYLTLSRFFTNDCRLREGYYYQTTPQGKLIKAVHVLEGRSVRFVKVPLVPVRYADFEAEKVHWVTNFDLDAGAQSQDPSAQGRSARAR